jgi:FlaA1/EpsC-like NDP-sugar epimerase
MPKRPSVPSSYRLAQLGLDGAIAALVCMLAYLIRFEGNVYTDHQTLFFWLPLLAIPGRLLTQTAFGLYQQVWRLFGIKDTLLLFHAVTFYSLGLLVTTRLLLPRVLDDFRGIPLSVAVIDWSFCLMAMVAIRYTRRWVNRKGYKTLLAKKRRPAAHRTLVLGAGQAGAQIVQESQQNPQFNFQIVGFLDDDPSKLGRKVEGVRVLGTTAKLADIAKRLEVSDALIAMPSAAPKELRRIVDLAQTTPLKLRTLPGPAELLLNRTLLPQARAVQITDILGRPEVRLDFDTVLNPQFPSAQAQVHQRTILVTGAGGTIGGEICRQLARLHPARLILLGRGENSIFTIERELRQRFPHLPLVPVIADIRHPHRMASILKTYRPHILFHAAAHKHVPLMEGNPTEALENNALASIRLAQLADQHSVESFVLISTDKAVDPSNFMGLSKRLAELLVRAIGTSSPTRFLAVRFGNVLGSRGSVVPIFQQQIDQGGPITVTDSAMTRYFMTVPEASQLVVQSLAIGQTGQTLILDMGDPIRIYDLAAQMIHLAGFRPNIDIPIKITGLRPGEKLHEALVGQQEAIVPTAHPRLNAIVGEPPSLDKNQTVIDALEAVIAEQLDPKHLWQESTRLLAFLEGAQETQVLKLKP